ncbi:MAG: Ku protein [Planctomycetota bacterium]
MAPRSSWKGFIKLSLVSVPVKGYTATASGGEIRLNQLHEECHNRIKYQKTCPVHGEVSKDDIVSGFEYSKGQYVVVDPDEVRKLRLQSDKSINVDGFIHFDEIDPLYYSGKTLYLLPDGPIGQKPFALLKQAMEDDDLYAVGKMILGGREQVILLRPLEDLLAVTVLTYKSKIKNPESFNDEIVDSSFAKEELKLTKTLVDASILDDFDFSKYTDNYVAQLNEIIEAKIQGQEIVAVPDPEEPKVINLMEALKKSVAQARGPVTRKRKVAAKKVMKKMAPSARSAVSKRKKKSG